jgi:hypothetical protein
LLKANPVFQFHGVKENREELEFTLRILTLECDGLYVVKLYLWEKIKTSFPQMPLIT